MEALFLSILKMSATASAVILAVLLARLLLMRAPKKYSYFLWAAVGFRMCCPFSLKSEFSLFRLADAAYHSPDTPGNGAGGCGSFSVVCISRTDSTGKQRIALTRQCGNVFCNCTGWDTSGGNNSIFRGQLAGGVRSHLDCRCRIFTWVQHCTGNPSAPQSGHRYPPAGQYLPGRKRGIAFFAGNSAPPVFICLTACPFAFRAM